MFSGLGSIITWWSGFFLIGLIFFPLTKKIFSSFFDKGYLFSKVLGTLFVSYLVWLFSSLKILPFYTETIWMVLIICFLANWVIGRKKIIFPSLKSIFSFFKSTCPTNLFIWISEELVFFITLAFWSYIRGFQPDIQGLEKYMDFGFVNSILRTKYFPPADMWFAGKFINYYYFGHYITAILTKLSGINSATTYNLMIGTLFAYCFSLTFSLTANLIYFWKKSIEEIKEEVVFLRKNIKIMVLGGLITAFLISFGANLHPAFYNFKMKILKKPYCDGSLTYWYPNATRYIGVCPDVEDKTIHEFPSYSFIVSDLHGHVSDIPFVLTFLASVFVLFFELKDHSGLHPFRLLSSTFHLPFLFSVFYMTNQWDYPIYIIILGFVLLFGFYHHSQFQLKTFINCFIYGAVLTLPSLVLVLPFQKNFEPFFKGVAFVNSHSLFYQLLILWGVPWFFGIVFLIYLFKNKIKISFKKESIVKQLSKLFGVEIEIKNQEKIQTKNIISLSDQFIIILSIVSLLLIIIPEIVYLKDIYIASHHRANTMFKLTYQSFMMYCILVGYITIRVLTSLKQRFVKKILGFIFVFLILCLLIYPNYSIPGYYGKLQAENYKGIYGLRFIERINSDDYKTILWLNNNLKGQPVILEAAGDSYTDYERISMATGLPTVQGWLVHEWLWRGSYDEPGKRAGEVQTIYETKDQKLAKENLDKYKVEYVVIGEMERQKYPNINEDKFEKIGQKVFESGKTKIYKLL